MYERQCNNSISLFELLKNFTPIIKEYIEDISKVIIEIDETQYLKYKKFEKLEKNKKISKIIKNISKEIETMQKINEDYEELYSKMFETIIEIEKKIKDDKKIFCIS